MPASPRTRSARWSRENGPISSSSTAIRPRSTPRAWRELRYWKPGSLGGRSGAGCLALHRPSAVNEHRRREQLRQFLGRLARRVPEVERNAGAPAAFEEARDRRIAVGPVAGEDL